MKKILLLGLLIVSMLSACDKDKDVAPGDRPDERLNKLLSEYKSQLVNAEHGWKATLFPEGGAGYSFLFDFNENDRVVTRSDIDAVTSAAPLESTYRLKAVQRPSLLFDTYTYLHVLADPDATKSGGDWGQGRYSDFEFSFDKVTPDSIVLTGNYNGSKLVLVRATADEAANYISRINESAEAFEGINNFTLYFKQLRIGSQMFDIRVNTDLRIITFAYEEGGTVKTFTTSYYYTPEGLTLLQPLVSGGLTIRNLNALEHDAARNRIDLTVNGVAASIRESSKPANIDPQAARTFYNSPPNGAYWQTIYGFTVEGDQDAFNVRAINNLEIITLYIKASPPYDGFIFWTTTGGFFGPALRSRIMSDGRIEFSYIGDFGTVPEQAAPMVKATLDQLVIPEGYYVIRTSNNTYDLVSAKDGKTWISFQ